MNEIKDARVKEILQHSAAEFLNQTVGGNGVLITVSKVEIFDRAKKATVFFTVLPDNRETEILTSAKRLRSDFRKYLHEKTAIVILPFIDFSIDFGEKNRHRINAISANSNS